jgi:hypothetical protein
LPPNLILSIGIVLFAGMAVGIDHHDNEELRIDNSITNVTDDADDVVFIEVPVVAEQGKDDDYACLNMYYEHGVGIKLVMAVWPNGRIVWSTNNITGGEPYFESRISEVKIRRVLDNLAVYGVYQCKYIHSYPERPYNALNICDRERKRVAMILLPPVGYIDVAGRWAGVHGITNTIYSLIPNSGTNIQFQYEYSFIKYRLRWCPVQSNNSTDTWDSTDRVKGFKAIR